MAENESISLIDDEDDLPNVKTEQNDGNNTDGEHESIFNENDFCLNFENDFDSSEIPNSNQSNKNPATESTSVIPDFNPPTLTSLEDIRLEIKEEASWMAQEYERPNEDLTLVATVDLCCSGDEENYVPIEVTQQKQIKRKRKDDDVDHSFGPTPQPLPLSSESKKKKIIPESEKNRLVNALKLDPKLLKTKAHVTNQSRGQRLALNMLGIDQPGTSSQTISNKTITSTNNSKNTETNNIEIQLDDSIPCSLTNLENDFITEITGWNIQWLAEKGIDVPVVDKNYASKNIPCKFNTVQEYIEYMISFLKIELWQSISATLAVKYTEQSILCQLLSVKYVNRNNAKRILCICEAKTLICSNQKIFKDNLVVIKHTHGRFFAFVTKIKYTKIGKK